MGNSFYTVDTAVAPGTEAQQYPGLGYVYPAADSKDNTQPLFNWYHPGGNGQHFLTASADGEGGNAQKLGYGNQKVECNAPVAGTAGAIPVYRYWHQNVGDHCFSRSDADSSILGDGYVLEGLAFHVFADEQPGTVILRYWNIGDLPKDSPFKGTGTNGGYVGSCPKGYIWMAKHGCVPAGGGDPYAGQ